MELRHIALDALNISTANMRVKGKAPDLANILPSVRARGVLVPLIVRQKPCPEPVEGGSAETFEIVAGKRRYLSAVKVAEETGEAEPLPCVIIAAGDDAAALEASLIENIARLDPDEVTRWETFTRLVREGRTADDIATTFGLTELQVKRTLALGNLCPRIRSLYRRGDIDAATMRHLTLATKAQQQAWLALVDDPEVRCPTGQQLKAWLFGGTSIAVSAALFDVETYEGSIVSDLFGDERYFSDADAFWVAQHVAIEARAEAYRADGWREVVVLPVGEHFASWEHDRRSKRQGAKVFVAVSPRGEVVFHEGFVTMKEARALAKGESVEKPVRPEVSAPLQNYIDLHRHAVVRAQLAASPSAAFRLAVAHMIVGSSLWHVRIEPQRSLNDAIGESVETAPCEAGFDARRRAVLAVLGLDAEAPTVTGGCEEEGGIAALFLRLLDLPDPAIFDALAIVMAETLEAGTGLIELLGSHFTIDMAAHWQADDAMLDLIRDREVLDAILSEVAGEAIAEANAKATGKIKRGIVRDCLTGEGGRPRVEAWVPRWMQFPPSAYTARGGVGTVSRAERLAAAAPAIASDPELQPEPLRKAA
ncbi:MAG: ParB N-terminal domain-containing protein [Pseudomonadota bacterium]